VRWAFPGLFSVEWVQEDVMHVPIKLKSERQRRRALRTLLEVEVLHVAQCEYPDKCEMLHRLREDIAEVISQLEMPSTMCH